MINNYKNSVINIINYAQELELDSGFRPNINYKTLSGTGSIISYKNRLFVVTNAHVVANMQYLTVKFAMDRDRRSYKAIVKIIDHDCDLALLMIEDKNFLVQAQGLALEFNINLGDNVMALGFPIGGQELCLSEGIISRIELTEYNHNVNLLAYQTTAAINSGNSGGPVLSNNKIIGLAFKGYDDVQNIAYIIPSVILKRFLDDYLLNTQYLGIPELGIEIQALSNNLLRKYLRINHCHLGVRVKSVDNLSSGDKKLFPDDILLAIDGYDIFHDGKIYFKDLPIYFEYLVSLKQIGDIIKLKLLRNNRELTIEIILTTRLNSTWLMAQEFYPKYYINNNFIFAPFSAEFNDFSKVIIAGIVPHKDSVDYEDYIGKTIAAVNNSPIENFNNLMYRLNKSNKKLNLLTTDTNDLIAIRNNKKLKNNLKNNLRKIITKR